jgi:alpha-glucosidase
MPVQRSLSIDYPFDARVFDHQFQNQYMFGPAILVCPTESTRDILKVFLPEGEWYSVYNGHKYTGNQEVFIECPIHRLPVFVKGGSVLPMKKPGINTKEHTDTLILHVYNGSSASSFDYYEDDGETFDYQKGNYSRRKISFDPTKQSVHLSACEGSYQPVWKTIVVYFHGFAKLRDATTVDFSYFTPIQKYDPIADPEWIGSENVQTISIPFTIAQIDVQQ